MLLGGRRPAQRDERIVDVRRVAAIARDGLSAGDEAARPDVPLTGPGAAEVDEIPAVVGQVDDGAHRAAQGQRSGAVVAEAEAPGDDGQVPEDRVRQGGDDPGAGVDST